MMGNTRPEEEKIIKDTFRIIKRIIISRIYIFSFSVYKTNDEIINKTNEIINKIAARIIWQCINLSYL